jgi:hypothetical protein
MQFHASFHLIEELVPGFDMEVEPRIGPAQDHHQEILVVNQQTIGSERRVEVRVIFVDPPFEMVSGKQIHTTLIPMQPQKTHRPQKTPLCVLCIAMFEDFRGLRKFLTVAHYPLHYAPSLLSPATGEM